MTAADCLRIIRREKKFHRQRETYMFRDAKFAESVEAGRQADTVEEIEHLILKEMKSNKGQND